MNHWTKGTLSLTACALVGTLGCGSKPSMSEIVGELKTPTGTVDATSAKEIGVELEKQLTSSSGLNGEREDIRSKAQAESAACPNGGSLSASQSGDQNNGYLEGHYNNCCLAPDCCFNGSLNVFYDASSADYTTCVDYDLSFSCSVDSGSGPVASSGDIDIAMCLSANASSGSYVYLIEVNGLSYRVSGTVAGGSGTLEITGANGTYSCTYTSGSGTCTGTSGTFSF